MMSHKSTRGFTLIEVVVVVTILVLLAGVLIPIVSNELSKAKAGRAQSDLKSVADSFSRYFAHTGGWPSNANWDSASYSKTGDEALSGMPCLYDNVYNRTGWAGPYLNSGVKNGNQWNIAMTDKTGTHGLADPWGQPYRIYYFGRGAAMGAGGGIVVMCAGENAKVDSSTAQLANGEASGDDVIQVVTRRL